MSHISINLVCIPLYKVKNKLIYKLEPNSPLGKREKCTHKNLDLRATCVLRNEEAMKSFDARKNQNL